METGSVRKIRTEPLASTTFHDLGILVAFQCYIPVGEEGLAVKILLWKNKLFRIQISSILLSTLLFVQTQPLRAWCFPTGCKALMQSA